jgi:hypothetical protein
VANLSNRALIKRSTTSVQREHTRVIQTKRGQRQIRVNRGVQKKNTKPQTPQVAATSPKTISRRRARVPMKKTSSDLKSISIAKKRIIKLPEHVHYATRIVDMGQTSGPMSAAGMITFELSDGTQKTLMMEFRSSMASAIDFLYEKLERKEPVLFGISEWGEFQGAGEPEEDVEYKEWKKD